MTFSTDYSRTFFDLQTVEPARRTACERDFLGGCAELLARLGAARDEADATARRLWQRMTGPDRHYHTPVHVLAMVCWADRLGMELTDAEALAVWFHDAVWQGDAAGDANEQASATWLGEQAERLGIADERVEEAMAAIRWTARHTEAEAPRRYERVMDLDLAGFASEPAVFAEQSRAVRAELAPLSEAAIAAGTIKLFEALLQRPRIYRSAEAAEIEQPARRQLGAEIQRLKPLAAEA